MDYFLSEFENRHKKKASPCRGKLFENNSLFKTIRRCKTYERKTSSLEFSIKDANDG